MFKLISTITGLTLSFPEVQLRTFLVDQTRAHSHAGSGRDPGGSDHIVLTGLFMTPISITLVLLVWGYGLAWFLVNDQIKVLGVKYLNRRAKTA